MSFILQTHKPGLSEDDTNKSNMDTFKVTPSSGRFPKGSSKEIETKNGKKQTEKSSKIKRIEMTDFLFFARFIAG